MTNDQLAKHLKVLHIEEDISNVTLRTATVAFHKLALTTHPDKVGEQFTAIFQELCRSYELIRDHFKANNQATDFSDVENDDEGKFCFDNFEKFNFPFENQGSFTVSIEDHLANTWQECIEKVLGEPKVVKNPQGTECDRSWKTNHCGIQITVHIYNNPKNGKGSKLMIHGRIQSLICSFVFSELPKIYKLVCNNKPNVIESNFKQSSKAKKKPNVKCDLCNFKSTLIQMKLHIKNVHTRKPQRASKRLQEFTPIVKQTKRPKSIIVDTFDKIINNEASIDDSMLMMLESPKNNRLETLHEQVTSPNLKTQTPETPVELNDLVSCNLCDFDCETEEDMKEHLKKGIHNSDNKQVFKCEECHFVFTSTQLLQKHMITNHQTVDQASTMSQNTNSTILEISDNSGVSHEVHTISAIIEDTTKLPIVQPQHQLVVCPFCKLQSKNLDELKKHIENIHHNQTQKQHSTQDVISVKEKQICFKCQYCKFTGTKLEIKAHHNKEHTRGITCEECGNIFQDSEVLKLHSNTHHRKVAEELKCNL